MNVNISELMGKEVILFYTMIWVKSFFKKYSRGWK